MTDEILQSSTEAALTPVSPGASLSAARNEIGLSVADVARSLRLSVRQIEAIEADDFDRLPGKTFLRGFVRNYAKLLNIDPEPLLEACQQTATQPRTQSHAISVPPGEVEISASRGQRTFSGNHPSPWLKYAPVVFVVALLGWVAFEFLGGNNANTVVVKSTGEAGENSMAVPLNLPPAQNPAQGEQTPPAPQEAPAAPTPSHNEGSAPAAPQAASQDAAIPQGAAKVKLTFSGESWIDLKDKSGRTIFKQTGQAGNEQVISGTPPLALTVGKAVNVKVYYNEQLVDLVPHTNGDVARLTLN